MSDSYFPDVFTLDDGAVTLIETSKIDPRVWMDALGFHATDDTGTDTVDISNLGTVDITGRVHSTGMDFDLDPAKAPIAREVRWLDSGVEKASIFAQLDAGAGTDARLLVTVNGKTYTIADGPFSSFVQAHRGLQPDTMLLDCGSGTVTWPGGSPRCTNLIVPHHFTSPATIPQSVVAIASTSLSGGLALPVFTCFNLTNANFTITAVPSDGSAPAAGTTANFFWIAIA